MDGAKITSINTAMDMAFTAAGNRIPTSACKHVPYHTLHQRADSRKMERTLGQVALRLESATPYPGDSVQ